MQLRVKCFSVKLFSWSASVIEVTLLLTSTWLYCFQFKLY